MEIVHWKDNKNAFFETWKTLETGRFSALENKCWNVCTNHETGQTNGKTTFNARCGLLMGGQHNRRIGETEQIYDMPMVTSIRSTLHAAHTAAMLQYPIGIILEAIIEFCCQRVHTWFDHGVDQQLQLVLSHSDMETVFQAFDRCSATTKARKLWACIQQQHSDNGHILHRMTFVSNSQYCRLITFNTPRHTWN